jgi:hypothetical protein
VLSREEEGEMHGRRGGGAKKKKQKKKAGWFEKLTVEELKDLARATKQPVGGNKVDLIARLLHDPRTASYNLETRVNWCVFPQVSPVHGN